MLSPWRSECFQWWHPYAHVSVRSIGSLNLPGDRIMSVHRAALIDWCRLLGVHLPPCSTMWDCKGRAFCSLLGWRSRAQPEQHAVSQAWEGAGAKHSEMLEDYAVPVLRRISCTDMCSVRRNSPGVILTLVVPRFFPSPKQPFLLWGKYQYTHSFSWESSNYPRRKWISVHSLTCLKHYMNVARRLPV